MSNMTIIWKPLWCVFYHCTQMHRALRGALHPTDLGAQLCESLWEYHGIALSCQENGILSIQIWTYPIQRVVLKTVDGKTTYHEIWIYYFFSDVFHVTNIKLKKKKYNARYNVEKKGKTVCKQLFSIIIILHKISKQKKQKQIYLLSLKFLFHIADHYIM